MELFLFLTHTSAYVTPTNIKMLAMLQDPIRESDLKLVFVSP
jgi:hypothetical protein